MSGVIRVVVAVRSPYKTEIPEHYILRVEYVDENNHQVMIRIINKVVTVARKERIA